GEAPAVQRFEIERRAHRAIHVTDDRQTTLEAETLDALREDAAAHVVDDQANALAVGRFHHRVVEVRRARADADVQPDLLEPRQLLGRARRADDLRAQGLARLQ